MALFAHSVPYAGPVLAWSGTTVDPGCMGPATMFVEAFRSYAIDISVADAGQFMGLEKKNRSDAC